MSNFKIVANVLLVSLLIFFSHCTETNKPVSDPTRQVAPDSAQEAHYSAADFSAVKKFDSHVHISIVDSTFIKQADTDGFKLLNVNVHSPSSPPIEEQQDTAVRLTQLFPDKIKYATTISVDDFNTPGWKNKTLEYLKNSFAQGAVAVKIWKNVGMALRDVNGKLVMIDNPAFDPIIDFIEKNDITLLGHFGEPRNCWLPVDQMTVSGDKQYFTEHPQYHMYLHPEYPSYEEQVAVRDRMLEKHPGVRFVGAHLGSLEWNVEELAKRLDKFPNMAVDMAARISHLRYQAVSDWKKVRDFMIKYQDRLIYATDEGVDKDSDREQVIKSVHENWLNDWKFFTSSETMNSRDVEKPFNGLKLPREVVDKIYLKNAEKWFKLKNLQ